jgi:hypothetical protein
MSFPEKQEIYRLTTSERAMLRKGISVSHRIKSTSDKMGIGHPRWFAGGLENEFIFSG